MIEQVLQGSRLMVLMAVTASAIASVLMYLSSLSVLWFLLIDLLQGLPQTADVGKALAVKLLKMLDMLLIAITFQAISASLYRLFVAPTTIENSALLQVLKIRSFHDLKITLLQVSVVILVIVFLEQAVEHGAVVETLYLGAGMALMIAAIVFAWKHLD